MVLKVQPHLERGYFFFADSNLILMNRFYVKYYSSIKIRCSMHNGINTNLLPGDWRGKNVWDPIAPQVG